MDGRGTFNQRHVALVVFVFVRNFSLTFDKIDTLPFSLQGTPVLQHLHHLTCHRPPHANHCLLVNLTLETFYTLQDSETLDEIYEIGQGQFSVEALAPEFSPFLLPYTCM